ncbi:MAG: pentapeptide repeat-containing protein [Lentilitoribacter sp.]
MDFLLSPTMGMFASIALFMAVGFALSEFFMFSGRKAGKSIEDVKNMMEIRKSTFTILGAVSILFTVAFSLSELGLKNRAEDRQLLYSALGQLVAVDDERPEISAAALLQLGRLGNLADVERPALARIVAAYVNENAKRSDNVHDQMSSARADIQVALLVLSELIANDAKIGELVELRSVDLAFVQMQKFQFPGVAIIDSDFRKANLSDTAFVGATLTSSVFEGAVLKNMNVSDATLDFIGLQDADVRSVNFCVAASSHQMKISQVGLSEGAQCLQEEN